MSQTHAKPDRESPPSIPGWVKVSGIIVIVLILLFVILHLTGNGFGDHMHTMPAGQSGQMLGFQTAMPGTSLSSGTKRMR